MAVCRKFRELKVDLVIAAYRSLQELKAVLVTAVCHIPQVLKVGLVKVFGHILEQIAPVRSHWDLDRLHDPWAGTDCRCHNLVVARPLALLDHQKPSLVLHGLCKDLPFHSLWADTLPYHGLEILANSRSRSSIDLSLEARTDLGASLRRVLGRMHWKAVDYCHTHREDRHIHLRGRPSCFHIHLVRVH